MASDMNARESDNQPIRIGREIPLWGILTVIGSLFVMSYSVYAGYGKAVEAIDRLSIAVDKLKDNQVENTIRYNTHSQILTSHTLEIQKLERDIEELKNRQRWAPK
jgi:hypothetical protein